MRTRGENWKLRVPLLKPVGKRELQEVAARYGLEDVLAQLKERKEAREEKPVEATQRDSRNDQETEKAAFGADSLAEGMGSDDADGADDTPPPPDAGSASSPGEPETGPQANLEDEMAAAIGTDEALGQ